VTTNDQPTGAGFGLQEPSAPLPEGCGKLFDGPQPSLAAQEHLRRTAASAWRFDTVLEPFKPPPQASPERRLLPNQ